MLVVAPSIWHVNSSSNHTIINVKPLLLAKQLKSHCTFQLKIHNHSYCRESSRCTTSGWFILGSKLFIVNKSWKGQKLNINTITLHHAHREYSNRIILYTVLSAKYTEESEHIIRGLNLRQGSLHALHTPIHKCPTHKCCNLLYIVHWSFT